MGSRGEEVEQIAENGRVEQLNTVQGLECVQQLCSIASCKFLFSFCYHIMVQSTLPCVCRYACMLLVYTGLNTNSILDT